MADTIELMVDGQRYGGWKDVRVDLAIDTLASAFDLQISERSPDDGRAAEWLARAGAEVQVLIGGDTVITGYLDSADPAIEAEDHSISVAGRSRAADLIDCSAVHQPGSWSGKRMDQIARDIVAPFNIDVVVEGDVGAPFPKFALQTGESVFDALERMGRMRGVLTMPRSDGAIVIAPPSPTGSAARLELGRNLKRVSARHDASQRFSLYIVSGQQAGSDNTHGRAASQIRAEASDAGITRHRPLFINAEDQATPASSRTRAAWEATTRAARGQTITATVPGWRREDGGLWQPRQRVDLIAPQVFASGELMVSAVSFQKSSDAGSVTELTLGNPAAFQPEPVPAEAEAGRVRGRAQQTTTAGGRS